MTEMFDDLAPFIGAMLAAMWGRARIDERSSAKRMAKFRRGRWFMIPLAFVEERDSKTLAAWHLSKRAGRRRLFEVRVNAAPKGGVQLGWWDATRLGQFPELIQSGKETDLADGMVALRAESGSADARVELQKLDLVILREVLSGQTRTSARHH